MCCCLKRIEEREWSPGPSFLNSSLACCDSGPVRAPGVLFEHWSMSQLSAETGEKSLFENSLLENTCLPWRGELLHLTGQRGLFPPWHLGSWASVRGLALPPLETPHRCGKGWP